MKRLSSPAFAGFVLCSLALYGSALPSPLPVRLSPPSSITVPVVHQISQPGEPVTMKVVNISLVDFFRIISELSGLNILIDPTVEGTITLNVDAVPWDQLFEVVLRSHRLEKSVEGNLVRISTKETLRQEEEETQKLKRATYLATDTITVTKHLNYAAGHKIVETLEQQLTERGLIDVDERTNTLIITDIPGKVHQLLGLAETLDAPELQVEIEARIVEVTTHLARAIGTELGFMVGKSSDRVQGTLTTFAPALETVGSGRLIAGRVLDTVQLDAVIAAAERSGEARILSQPRVTAQNNAEALITQGARIPIPVQQNFATTVRFEAAALQLTVTPQVTEKETVLLNIKVENNVPDFTRTVLGIPIILTSESQTMVLVPDGGTTVIGGIFVEVKRKQKTKFPGLGDVPILGHLFKNINKERETREILFFITSRIKSLD